MMKSVKIILGLSAIICLVQGAQGIRWLALSKLSTVATIDTPDKCENMAGSLIKKQINFCKRNTKFMNSVRLGAARAIDECQFQFRSRRWNCSTLEDTIGKEFARVKAHLEDETNFKKPFGSGGGHANLLGDLQTINLPPAYQSAASAVASSGRHNGIGAAFGFGGSYENYNRKQIQNYYSRDHMRTVRRGRRLSRKARHGSASDDNDTANDSVLPNAVNPIADVNGTVLPPKPLDVVPSVAPEKPKKDKKKKRRNGGRGKKKQTKWQDEFDSYPVVSPGTREMAFVHAISSAGVAHALTRACSSGELENCGCDRSLRGMSPEGFQWSGCSDNVDFGITFSRTFVDARDRRKSRKSPKKAQPLMNLHNNEAGRKLLERNMKVDCKCHGVSGSCELKTCWRSVASFRMIGQILKDKFDSAHEVQQRKRRGRRMLLPRFLRYKPHTDVDLVYLRPSPDYCEKDVKRGSLGTHGRECNPKSKGIDGCDLMCCNRGYTTRREHRVERCHCKFHWCCFVECEECYKEVEVSTCN